MESQLLVSSMNWLIRCFNRVLQSAQFELHFEFISHLISI
jgi:hypothetical protein